MLNLLEVITSKITNRKLSQMSVEWKLFYTARNYVQYTAVLSGVGAVKEEMLANSAISKVERT